MPAAPPDAAASTSARRRADENRDSYPAGTRTLTPEFQRRVAHRELAGRTPEARQIPGPASRALLIKFSGCLYPAYVDIHLRELIRAEFKLRCLAYPDRIGLE